MNLFGPTNTLKSIAQRLINGLKDGTIHVITVDTKKVRNSGGIVQMKGKWNNLPKSNKQ